MITIEQRKTLRRKSFWRVADFARYTGMSHEQARRMLRRYDVELHGMLLRRSAGANRLFGFFWSALAKHAPDAFVDDPLETQRRVDDIEDQQAELHERTRSLGAQTGANTREIEKLKAKTRSAA